MEKNNPAVCLAVWFSGFFGLGTVMHLVRLILQVPVTVGSFEVPLAASGVLLAVFGGLSAGLLILGCKKSRCDKG